MSDTEKILTMLEALAAEIASLKTEQESLKRLLLEHTKELKEIKETARAQSERSDSLLERFERKYQGMGA